MIQCLAEQIGKLCITDQLTADPDPFVELDKMRAGIDMDGESRRLDRRTQKCTGRSLAVGPCDMKDRRQMALRIAQSTEEFPDPFKSKRISTGGEAFGPVQLALNARIFGNGIVRHLIVPGQAALVHLYAGHTISFEGPVNADRQACNDDWWQKRS